ncbi:unnamed protein product, partial [Darwinula stevensoni]
MWNQSGIQSPMKGGGGGFMNTTGDFSPSTQADRKGRARIDTLIPVSVQNILSCQDDVLKIAGLEARMLVLMGKVKRAEAHPTRVDYYVDDDTGTIKCTLWKDQEQDKELDHDDPDQSERPEQKYQGKHVRIVGQLRSQGGERHVLILKIFPLSSDDELHCHNLEIKYAEAKIQHLQQKQ